MLDKSKMSKPYPAQKWRMPTLSTVWLCDDGVKRTLGEMLDGMDGEFITKDDQDVLMVLERFGCDWTSPIVNYSFTQRDEAVAELSDSSRYMNAKERFAGFPEMRWVYDALANETIGEFVSTHLPDAYDWVRSTYRVTSLDGEEGLVYRVETEIPTNSEDCWVSFEIAMPGYGDDPMVLFFQAIRSGIDDGKTYACRSVDGEWEECEPDDDEETLNREG